MREKIKALFVKRRELVMYLIFGVLTTAVNYVAYFAFSRLFVWSTTLPPTAIAWVAAVAFAYATNRKWVFNSAVTGAAPVIKEIASFTGARLLSGLADMSVMYIAVDVMRYPDWITKILSNVIVVVLNYVLSKLLVFRKTKGG